MHSWCILASIASLPPDVFEAARIDRAGAWKRFIYITLPLIRPAIVIVIILRLMTALSAFAAIFAATGGGPGTATEILNLYAYRTSFTELNLGYGAALAMVLLALTLDHLFHAVPAAARAMSSRRWRTIGLDLDCGAAAVDMGDSGVVGTADVVQDRARCACVSAAGLFRADALQLS